MTAASSDKKSGFGAQQWATLIIVVALGAAIIRIAFWLAGGSAAVAGQVYFYDLSTGELFAASPSRLPPIAAPSDTGGNLQGVRAYVYACGDCSDSQPREIGYLMMYTSQYALAIEKLGRGETLTAEETGYTVDPQTHTLVRRVDDERWSTLASREGQRIMQSANTIVCPDDIQLVLCMP